MNEGTAPETLFELLEKYTVEVPKVQRDYAQGRTDEDTVLVRNILLNDMKESILGDAPPLDLSFVYGKVYGKASDNGRFIPVDGQQRLTTLFLLHVYAFHSDDEKTWLLKKFTYETRKSSRDFLEKLVEHRGEVFSSPNKPSFEIEDSEWFVFGWKYDPTVRSVLVMLDAIREIFGDAAALAVGLYGEGRKPVIFQFLDVEELGMEDSLYIKLNARGKPLTQFENFKARLIGRLKQLDRLNQPNQLHSGVNNEFEGLLDGKWTDLFWESHREDFDRTFLLFFGIMLMNEGVIASDNNWSNAFDYQKLDADMFEAAYYTLDYLSSHPEDTEARDLFFNALVEGRRYPDRVLFHAITTYLHRARGISGGGMRQWLRILKNLVLNTRINDLKSFRGAIDGISNIAAQWDSLLVYFANGGAVSGFSVNQISEERTKAKLILRSESFESAIYNAEKHPYFSGQIRSALGFATDADGGTDLAVFNEYWEKISVLFDKNKPVHDDTLRQALLSIGDYTLKVGDYKTLCVNDPNEGESTPSMKRLFSNCTDTVRSLLDAIDVDKDIKRQLCGIIDESAVPANDWRYCFIKFPDLFKLMSVANLRLREVRGVMLIIRNKSSNGYNRQVFLAALSEALRSEGISSKQEAEQGTWSNHWMRIENEEDVYVKYDNGAFSIYRGAEADDESNDLLFKTSSEDPISEATSYIAEKFGRCPS